MSDSAQQHCWSHPAFRGGAVVAAGSLLWVPFLTNEAFGRAMYLLTAPAVLFPIGALIGTWLGKQVKKLTWTQTLLLGLLAGCAASLLAVAGFWILLMHEGLFGLVRHTGGCGSRSYHYAVVKVLKEFSIQLVATCGPIMLGAVPLLALWEKRRCLRCKQSTPQAPKLQLGLDHLKVWGVIAGWMALSMFFALASHAPLPNVLLNALGSAGLTITGPWMVMIVHPGGSLKLATYYSLFAFPILAFAFSRFFLNRKSVTCVNAVSTWCLFITAILFWTAVGVIVVGHSMG